MADAEHQHGRAFVSPAPLRIDCEGSGCPGHGKRASVDYLDRVEFFLTMCAMCGRNVEASPCSDGRERMIALPHQRDDVLAMIERGDYG